MFTCFCGMFRLLLTAVQIPVAQAHSTSYELTVTQQHMKNAKHVNHILCTVPYHYNKPPNPITNNDQKALQK